MPRKEIAQSVPVLSEELAGRDDETAFEELCVLYVAMTRAKQGLYVVTSYPGKSAKSLNSAAIVKKALTGEEKPVGGDPIRLGGEEYTCLFERGSGNWYESCPRRDIEIHEASGETAPAGAGGGRRIRPEQVVPSETEAAHFTASWLFDRESRESLEFGNAVHELFLGVGWMEDLDPQSLLERWEKETGLDRGMREAVREQFLRCLQSEEVRKALSRSGTDTLLWREKGFDVVLGDRWLSGIFDRVHLAWAGRGEGPSAVVYDYKSDRIEGRKELERAVERYRSQMNLYRQALAGILGAEPGRIDARLIFTGPGVVREVPVQEEEA